MNAPEISCEPTPQTFRDELQRLERTMKIYNLRYHLGAFPRNLVRPFWNRNGDMPDETTELAYLAYKAGLAPRRRLHKGPPHRPPLKIIQGGLAEAAT